MNNRTILLLFLTIITPLFAQYSFDFVCTSDTFQTGTDYFVYYFRLTNTGSQPDSYAFDCRVIDSVPGWSEIYCAGGQCAEPGIILYDYLMPGAVDTGIEIRVYPATGVWGTEIINLAVWSLHNPSLRDSINVYAAMEEGIYDYGGIDSPYGFEVSPNPFHKYLIIKFQSTILNPKSEILLRIYDITGRVIKSFNLESCIQQQTSGIIWSGDDNFSRPLPMGIYFVELKNGKDRIQRKVVKVR